MNKTYICIDLKSFYASVECRERKLDPLTTNLVVADNERTDKTICLAVTPSLKKYGLSGRCRLYQAKSKMNEVNRKRKKENNYKPFIGKSTNDIELQKNKNLELDFIIATPRMGYYMKYSTRIYNVYLKYVSKEDIYVYSIDEVFCDVTNYLNYYQMQPEELVSKMIQDVYNETGITATAGIGTNLFLAKIAMDIVAKHKEANEIGVRIASLDEMSYRRLLWSHKPITDFWRVGAGYAKRLGEYQIYTMGDIARCSINNEELLYKIFGVNAELLIDHAWGYEPCTIKSIKSIKPQSKSISQGQVLHSPYKYDKAKIIVTEMAQLLSLDLVEKGYNTNMLVLTINYDISNISSDFDGEIVKDRYGRSIPKPAHGTIRLKSMTSSSKLIYEGFLTLFDRIIDKKLLIRKINIAACNLESKSNKEEKKIYEQFNIFENYENYDERRKLEKINLANEEKIQEVMLKLKYKFGKNSILKGINLEEGATTIDRNKQIGGHRE